MMSGIPNPSDSSFDDTAIIVNLLALFAGHSLVFSVVGFLFAQFSYIALQWMRVQVGLVKKGAQ
jgi:hypothetical protein